MKSIVLGLKARFAAVARRKKKSKGGRGSGSDSEATSRFFAVNPNQPQTEELDRYGSSFLTPPDRPKPGGGKRKLRPRFKGRFFARLFKP